MTPKNKGKTNSKPPLKNKGKSNSKTPPKPKEGLNGAPS